MEVVFIDGDAARDAVREVRDAALVDRRDLGSARAPPRRTLRVLVHVEEAQRPVLQKGVVRSPHLLKAVLCYKCAGRRRMRMEMVGGNA